MATMLDAAVPVGSHNEACASPLLVHSATEVAL